MARHMVNIVSCAHGSYEYHCPPSANAGDLIVPVSPVKEFSPGVYRLATLDGVVPTNRYGSPSHEPKWADDILAREADARHFVYPTKGPNYVLCVPDPAATDPGGTAIRWTLVTLCELCTYDQMLTTRMELAAIHAKVDALFYAPGGSWGHAHPTLSGQPS